MTNFNGKGSDIRARKEKKNIQNKTENSITTSMTQLQLPLDAQLFVTKLMINQSLQGVGAGVEIQNFYIVPKRSPFSHAYIKKVC